jgi:hypothetical protein
LEEKALGAELIHSELGHLREHKEVLLKVRDSLLRHSADVGLELLREGLVVHGEDLAGFAGDDEFLGGLDFYIKLLLTEEFSRGVFIDEDLLLLFVCFSCWLELPIDL